MQEKKTGVCVGRLWNNIIGNRKEGQKMQIEGDQCRRCGSLQTEVIDRRYRKKVDRVIRRRKCLECGYKWNTVEVYAEDWERISRAGR